MPEESFFEDIAYAVDQLDELAQMEGMNKLTMRDLALRVQPIAQERSYLGIRVGEAVQDLARWNMEYNGWKLFPDDREPYFTK